MSARRHLRPKALGFAALGALLAFFPFMGEWPVFGWLLEHVQSWTGLTLTSYQMATFGVWLVVLTGLNLLAGYTGQISLGHGALVACGAYITAILVKETYTPFLVAIPLAGVLTGVLGFAIGVPVLRLRGAHLGIATLALIVALPQLLKLDALSGLTGGATGIDIPQARAPELLDGLLDSRQWLYYSVLLPAVVMTFLAWNLTLSRFGRAFNAIRDSEVGAQQMGVNVGLYKALAFGLSALYAGIGGGLYVYSQDFASPDSFSVFQSFTFLVAIVLGGLGSILGSVLAACFFTFQSGMATRLAEVVPAATQLRWAVFGVAVIVMMAAMPKGAAGLVRRVPGFRPADAFRDWRRGGVAASACPRSAGLAGCGETEANRLPIRRIGRRR